MKQDERQFIKALARKPADQTVRDFIANYKIRIERAYALLDKWHRKGWYNFKSPDEFDNGWLTREGEIAVRGL